MNSLCRVVLFQVHSPKQKLLRLIETAQLHFERKEPFSIFVEEEKTAEYVDQILWSTPETSFLPHRIADSASSDLVLITKEKRVLNGARAVFNLCATPLLIEGPFRLLYDFEDLTVPSRRSLSQLRFEAYKKAGYPIESRPG